MFLSAMLSLQGHFLTTRERYNLVWEETASLYYEMCSAEKWDTMDTVELPAPKVYTDKVRIFIWLYF